MKNSIIKIVWFKKRGGNYREKYFSGNFSLGLQYINNLLKIDWTYVIIKTR